MLSKIRQLYNIVRFIDNWYSYLFLRIGLVRALDVKIKHYNQCPIRVTRTGFGLMNSIIYLLALGAKYDPCNDVLTINFDGKTVVFKNILSLDVSSITFIIATFFRKDYSFLDVRDSVVVDIGASIEDTCIYFALEGAEKVVGFEPIPEICQYAKQAVEYNNLLDRISIVCAAIASPKTVAETRGKTYFCKNRYRHGASRIVEKLEMCKDDEEVIEVPLKTPPEADVAKTDCEGCEYDLVLNMENPLWREIGLEYHGEPEPLTEKLNQPGYKTKIVRDNKRQGILYAILYQ